tara:strand:+ start:27874 stop:28269 length:396 start_codon:yes stop_codon:yes gene_type:complete
MNGVTNLEQLLKTMKPILNEGDYVFCTLKSTHNIDLTKIVMLLKEKEGDTIILEKTMADNLQIPYSFVASWITLTVHSSLEAVGLTAAFSQALTNAKISCNVVAGYYHDHIFVHIKDAKKAMKVLNSFSKE